ncbi:MAG TPA: PilZ domain-containing protein [Nitrospiraceae bacterium]|jgi:hypothetical protein
MELRRHQRFTVHFNSVLSGPKLSEGTGTIVNLSEGGCCVETDSRVFTGIQLSLRLHVPNEDSPIQIDQAAVRWNRGREIGVGFITMTPLNQKRIADVLAKLKEAQKT